MTTIALCGAGMIAGAHALAAAELGIPIVAVASRTSERAGEVAGRVGAKAVAYESLPAGADIVVVATPPALHAGDTLRLLAAGAAVVVEKPLCRTLAEADLLVDAAEAHEHRLLYAENLAYSPLVLELLRRARRIGPLELIEVRTLQGLPTWGAFTSDEWGGGALFDLGVHPLAIALLVAGPAVLRSVRCDLRSGEGHRSDEHAEVDLLFDGGLRARVVSSWQAGPGPVWDAQVSSATGVVRAELFPDQMLEHDGEAVPLPPAGDPDRAILTRAGYIGQLEAFLDDLATRRDPVMNASFGRRVLEVVAAAYTSAGRSGEPVPLPFTGPRDRTPLQLWRS